MYAQRPIDGFLVKIKSLWGSKKDKFRVKNIIVTSVIIIATLETFQNNRPSIIIVANIDSFLPWTKNRLKRKKRKHKIQSPIQLFEPRTARGILHLFLLLLLFRIDLPGKQKTTLLYYPLRYQDVVTAIPITRDITIPLPSPLNPCTTRPSDFDVVRACFSILEERNRHCGYSDTDFYLPLLPNV